jgi:hypothetical protein
MSVKTPTLEQLDTTSKTPSGKKMIFDKEVLTEFVERYKKNLNENDKKVY